MTHSPTALIADDEPMLREALARLVADLGPGTEVLEADSIAAAQDRLAVHPDVTLVVLDIALRLEVYPVKGLTIAGVTYDSLFQRELAASKDRWEGDVRYEHGPYLVQAEYIRARDGGVSARVTGQGAYLALGYTIEDKALGSGSLQPVVRVGFFDSDVDNDVPATGADEVVHYDVGVNYYLRGHEMKLQGSYQRQQFDDKTANNQVIVAAQVAY